MGVLIKNTDVTVRPEEEGLYLAYNRRHSVPLVMNKTSYFIWDRCSEATDVASLARELSQQYSIQDPSITPERLEEITLEHIKLLTSVGLLVDTSAVTPAPQASVDAEAQ